MGDVGTLRSWVSKTIPVNREMLASKRGTLPWVSKTIPGNEIRTKEFENI